MLDSYFQEVRQKRRKSLIFWLLVLIFAIILFFFFNGKYISVNINWQFFLAEKNEASPVETSIESPLANPLISFHSFGIVNVKASPRDTKILLNNEPYINDSKPQIDYGEYKLSLHADGYISGAIDFSIDDAKNFYINTISLIPEPKYKKMPHIQDARIVKVAENAWIGHSQSGMLLYHNNFLSPKIISPKNLHSLGDGKFLSGTTIVEYNMSENRWIPEKNTTLSRFATRCEDIVYKYGVYFCPHSREIMTETGKIFAKVEQFGRNFLISESSLIIGDIASGKTKLLTFSGSFIPQDEKQKYFVEMYGDWWYLSHSGMLLNVEDTLINKPLSPHLNINSIAFFQVIGDTTFLLEKHNNMQKLIYIDAEGLVTYIDFPDISTDDMRIYEKNQNYFIKTRDALLLLYNDSKELKWLIDGKILAIGDDFALYEKENTIWLASWKEEKSIKK